MPVCQTDDMARPKQDSPSHFGDLVAVAIKLGMREYGISGRGLARRLSKSEGYVRDRLNGTYEFSLADVEHFALFIGVIPEEFIAAIDRKQLDPLLPEREDRLPTKIRTLADILSVPDEDDDEDDEVFTDDESAEAWRTNVRGTKKDFGLVANETIEEHPNDPDAGYDNA